MSTRFSSLSSRFLTVSDYRRRAALLLKDLRSGDPQRRDAAASRFSIHPLFAQPGGQGASAPAAQLKHALAVVAQEAGAPDWPSLKVRTEAVEAAELLYAGTHLAAFWNIWFASYEEARDVHGQKGGYLFPYRRHFFVSDEHFVRAVGLDPEAPEWQAIGFDWARPANHAAWTRLAESLRKHVRGQTS